MEIIRKEIDDTHYYYIDGVFAPSVTHILDVAAPKEYGLINFFKTNTPEDIDEISNKAKEQGSLVHDSCERLLNGVEVEIKDWQTQAKKKIKSFIDWYEQYKPTNYLTEHTVGVVTPHIFAGTLDFVGMIGDKLTLVDFKTNKSGIYYSNKLQVMAYKYAYEQMTGEKIEECWVLRLGTKHKVGYEFAKIEDVSIDNWFHIYETYLNMNGGKIPEPPMVDVYPDSLKLESISLRK
jgi:hypothetical protein